MHGFLQSGLARKRAFKGRPAGTKKPLCGQRLEGFDDSAQYPDWSNRDDIMAKLKVDLILLLQRYGFPLVANDEVYKSVLEQAENFKKYLQS